MSMHKALVRPKTAVPTSVASSMVDPKSMDMGAKTAAQFELTRLVDSIKLKDKQLEAQMREISALKSNLNKTQKELMSKQTHVEKAQETAAQAVGGAAANNKELAMLKADKKKLEGQVAEMMRMNARLKEQLERAADKNPGLSQQVAAMQSSVRSARASADAAAEELKAIQNQLRNKDKEMTRMSKLVDDATVIAARNGELENKVRELSKTLDDTRDEVRTLENVNRQRETDIAKLNKELMSCREALGAANAAHADTSATLKAMTNRYTEQEEEMSRMRDELARTSAVASRVAAAEVRAGPKGEGTVSMLQHLEDLKYWEGETNRLKEKVTSLEKQLAVSDELKARYRTTAERLSSAGLAADRLELSEVDPAERRASRGSSFGGRSTRAGAGAGSLGGSGPDVLPSSDSPAKPPTSGRVTRSKASSGAGAPPAGPARGTRKSARGRQGTQPEAADDACDTSAQLDVTA